MEQEQNLEFEIVLKDYGKAERQKKYIISRFQNITKYLQTDQPKIQDSLCPIIYQKLQLAIKEGLSGAVNQSEMQDQAIEKLFPFTKTIVQNEMILLNNSSEDYQKEELRNKIRTHNGQKYDLKKDRIIEQENQQNEQRTFKSQWYNYKIEKNFQSSGVFLCPDYENKKLVIQKIQSLELGKIQQEIQNINKEIAILKHLCQKDQNTDTTQITLPFIKKKKDPQKKEIHIFQEAGVLDFNKIKQRYQQWKEFGEYSYLLGYSFLILWNKLNYMHTYKNIAHSDIKPYNLVLGYDYDAYFIDFGAAVYLNNDESLRKYLCQTTPQYNLQLNLEKDYFTKQQAILCDLSQLVITFFRLMNVENQDLNDFIESKENNRLKYIETLSSKFKFEFKQLAILLSNLLFDIIKINSHIDLEKINEFESFPQHLHLDHKMYHIDKIVEKLQDFVISDNKLFIRYLNRFNIGLFDKICQKGNIQVGDAEEQYKNIQQINFDKFISPVCIIINKNTYIEDFDEEIGNKYSHFLKNIDKNYQNKKINKIHELCNTPLEFIQKQQFEIRYLIENFLKESYFNDKIQSNILLNKIQSNVFFNIASSFKNWFSKLKQFVPNKKIKKSNSIQQSSQQNYVLDSSSLEKTILKNKSRHNKNFKSPQSQQIPQNQNEQIPINQTQQMNEGQNSSIDSQNNLILNTNNQQSVETQKVEGFYRYFDYQDKDIIKLFITSFETQNLSIFIGTKNLSIVIDSLSLMRYFITKDKSVKIFYYIDEKCSKSKECIISYILEGISERHSKVKTYNQELNQNCRNQQKSLNLCLEINLSLRAQHIQQIYQMFKDSDCYSQLSLHFGKSTYAIKDCKQQTDSFNKEIIENVKIIKKYQIYIEEVEDGYFSLYKISNIQQVTDLNLQTEFQKIKPLIESNQLNFVDCCLSKLIKINDQNQQTSQLKNVHFNRLKQPSYLRFKRRLSKFINTLLYQISMTLFKNRKMNEEVKKVFSVLENKVQIQRIPSQIYCFRTFLKVDDEIIVAPQNDQNLFIVPRIIDYSQSPQNILIPQLFDYIKIKREKNGFIYKLFNLFINFIIKQNPDNNNLTFSKEELQLFINRLTKFDNQNQEYVFQNLDILNRIKNNLEEMEVNLHFENMEIIKEDKFIPNVCKVIVSLPPSLLKIMITFNSCKLSIGNSRTLFDYFQGSLHKNNISFSFINCEGLNESIIQYGFQCAIENNFFSSFNLITPSFDLSQDNLDDIMKGFPNKDQFTMELTVRDNLANIKDSYEKGFRVFPPKKCTRQKFLKINTVGEKESAKGQNLQVLQKENEFVSYNYSKYNWKSLCLLIIAIIYSVIITWGLYYFNFIFTQVELQEFKKTVYKFDGQYATSREQFYPLKYICNHQLSTGFIWTILFAVSLYLQYYRFSNQSPFFNLAGFATIILLGWLHLFHNNLFYFFYQLFDMICYFSINKYDTGLQIHLNNGIKSKVMSSKKEYYFAILMLILQILILSIKEFPFIYVHFQIYEICSF